MFAELFLLIVYIIIFITAPLWILLVITYIIIKDDSSKIIPKRKIDERKIIKDSNKNKRIRQK
jgi:hypothetical protein